MWSGIGCNREEINKMDIDKKYENRRNKMSKEIIDDVIINDTKIELAIPFEVKIIKCEDGDYLATIDDDFMFGVGARVNDEFTFFGFGETINEAIENCKKEFDLIYKMYVCCPDDRLAENDIQLKKRARKIIGADSDMWTVPVREMTHEDAKREIIKYCKRFGKSDTDVVSLVEALWLDIELVEKIVEELDKEHQFRWY